MPKLSARVVLSSAFCLLCVFCNRTVGVGPDEVATPNPDGTQCNNDLECASNRCVDDVCKAAASGQVEIDGDCTGAPCVSDATCQDGICVENASTCAALLAPCLTGDDCCSGHCAASDDGDYACVKGAGMCVVDGDTCAVDDDCCAGLCDFRASTSSGQGKCSSTCTGTAFGVECEVGSCCAGYCSTYDSYSQCVGCGEVSGVPDGTSCTTDSECCGEVCVGATAQFMGSCQCMTPGGC